MAERVDKTATATVAELQESGEEAMKILADVGTFAGAEGLMAETVKASGRIDVLVNKVGGTIWMQPYHISTPRKM